MKKAVKDNGTSTEQNVSWSAYHANRQTENDFQNGISTLLPLFMMAHALNIIAGIVQHLNPGQIPFATMDQPLYAVGKQLQWDFPETFGEDKFVLILGGLHTEMAIMKCIGDWLNESGWTNALVQANIASPGKADSFLKASHVTRTRSAHQLTACSLYILLNEAYTDYTTDMDEEPLVFDEWISEMKVPHFSTGY